MKQKELSDQELTDAAKTSNSSAILTALPIGFMIAVIAYSVVKNTWGL